MKVTVKISGLERSRVELVMYYLGPLADDGFIEDPRDLLRHWKAGEKNEIELRVNLDPDYATIEKITSHIEDLAVALGRAADGFVVPAGRKR